MVILNFSGTEGSLSASSCFHTDCPGATNRWSPMVTNGHSIGTVTPIMTQFLPMTAS